MVKILLFWRFFCLKTLCISAISSKVIKDIILSMMNSLNKN